MALTRRGFIKSLAAGSMALAGSSFLNAFADEGGNRPNILFIFSDDHATSAIGAYKGRYSEFAPTPNIDRLAREGMLFEHCYVTNSICMPSRATIMTGKHCHLNGQYTNADTFDNTQPTYPKMLSRAGYQTALFGKWHIRTDPIMFDYWDILPGQGFYYRPVFRNMKPGREIEGYVSDVTTDLALDWLDKRDKTKPFFMMLNHKAPHRNWMAAMRHLDMYRDVEIPMPENFFDDYEGRKAASMTHMRVDEDLMLSYDLKLPLNQVDKFEDKQAAVNRRLYNRDNIRLTPEQRKEWEAAYAEDNEKFLNGNLSEKEQAKWKFQRYVKDYLRCIASMDENIGRALDYLEKNGLAEDTIVVYSSDQGFFLGEHGWFDKRFIYEESLRMPFIVRYPGKVKPGSVSKAIVQNIDFAETFLDYAGVDIPADMQGRSLRPILEGNTPEDWRDAAYYHYYMYPGSSTRRHYGVRTHRYKLVHYYYKMDEWEFYDLEKDPMEMDNRYGDPAYAKEIAALRKKLKELQAQYKVPAEDPYRMPHYEKPRNG